MEGRASREKRWRKVGVEWGETRVRDGRGNTGMHEGKRAREDREGLQGENKDEGRQKCTEKRGYRKTGLHGGKELQLAYCLHTLVWCMAVGAADESTLCPPMHAIRSIASTQS